jgi:hypothetical protein
VPTWVPPTVLGAHIFCDCPQLTALETAVDKAAVACAATVEPSPLIAAHHNTHLRPAVHGALPSRRENPVQPGTVHMAPPPCRRHRRVDPRLFRPQPSTSQLPRRTPTVLSSRLPMSMLPLECSSSTTACVPCIAKLAGFCLLLLLVCLSETPCPSAWSPQAPTPSTPSWRDAVDKNE